MLQSTFPLSTGFLEIKIMFEMGSLQFLPTAAFVMITGISTNLWLYLIITMNYFIDYFFFISCILFYPLNHSISDSLPIQVQSGMIFLWKLDLQFRSVICWKLQKLWATIVPAYFACRTIVVLKFCGLLGVQVQPLEALCGYKNDCFSLCTLDY